MKRFQRTPKNLPYRRNVFILTEGEETDWIDIIQYQRLRVGDLSRGEVEMV